MIIDPLQVLRTAEHVVVQDFPDASVPDSLLAAGLTVTTYGGPEPADVTTQELVDGAVVLRQRGRRPDRADLLYVHRPLAEIDRILDEARRLGVRTLWRHADGPDGDLDDEGGAWRRPVEAAGLAYVQGPITGPARAVAASR